MQVLVLKGNPRQRGQAHGEQLRSLIAEHYDRWRAMMSAETGLDPADYLEKFFAATDFMPAIERYAPDLLEELHGIAEGSGQPFEHVLARQCSDEEPWFRQILRFGRPWPEHCSSLAGRGVDGKPNIVAQNMDSPGYYYGAETLLRIQDPATDIEAYVFTVAGKISLAGMNSRGVAIACNTVLQLDFNPRGLPEDFIVRKTLQQGSLAEALAFMHSIPHASGQNYVLGDPDDVTDIEASAREVSTFEPLQDPKRIYHTNHPLVNTDTSSWDLMMARGEREAPDLVAAMNARQTTYARCAAVQRGVEAARGIDVETAKAILSQHEGGVCIHHTTDDVNYTSGCLVMELDAQRPRLHLAPGPGCSTAFTTYEFNQ